ncbi:non-hydrolyzing UDP-N-acetylglucosamine 2-epimerase [Krasilnikovia sp. MM14-A1259]|uniref:non-hydrolyzing UDP-N-acetylglucosamine 2-epimerase n=1 Tax=Krasilnikovia sp. MM14-A1259 TaxID=3373539 RepID=UPI00399C8E41
MPPRVMLVFGTRPEAVKIAPVAKALAAADVPHDVVSTGQHGPMLQPILDDLGLTVDADLGLHRPGQTLTDVTTGVLNSLRYLLQDRRPDAVMVQGDTTSALAAALAAFYECVPVVHLEAGLRSGDLRHPWPEEGNRRLLAPLADLHLAPTPAARDNLLAEGVPAEQVLVTGNTVVDALHHVVRSGNGFAEPRLRFLDSDPDRRMVLVTAHRRESWGEGIRGIGEAILTIARRHPDIDVVMPVHPNPAVRAALPADLEDRDNVHLLPPVGYADLARLLARCHFVVTDSGGLQEEAPSLGRPLLVTREVTERMEAVHAGCARLVGTRREAIVDEAQRLLTDAEAYAAMASTGNPFGDGRAAERVVAALLHRYADGDHPEEFRPPATTRLHTVSVLPGPVAPPRALAS